MDIITTMITPYLKDGKIDYDTASRYVDWYYEKGLTGIFAVCQSSEIFYLSLEERIELNRIVYKRAKELERNGGRKFTVVSSGHVSDTLEGQIKELNAIYESGTDALILITIGWISIMKVMMYLLKMLSVCWQNCLRMPN